MDYIEVCFTIEPFSADASEILVAELGQLDFESFVETENGVMAYIQQKLWNDNVMAGIEQVVANNSFKTTYTTKTIEGQNWNALWESNFEPIFVGDKCLIKAPFHNIDGHFDYTIVIEPKMSFGTGHHETTYLMLQAMLNIDFTEKTVLDMGCGTGILAILASMKGAKHVTGIDIEDWTCENAIENAQRNNCNNIEIFLGDAKLLAGKSFDIIIANINRNVLLADMKAYANSLNKNGELLLSGFYLEDLDMITKEAEKNGFTFKYYNQKNKWIMASLLKHS